jgi:hypothetical protein
MPKPKVDLVALLANPRMIPGVVVALVAPWGVALAGVPVDGGAAIVSAVVILAILGIQLARQASLKNPAKIWRGSPRWTFVFNVGAVIVAGLGVFFAAGPWKPEFEVEQIFALQGGFAASGLVIPFAMAPVWIAQFRRQEGPFKRVGSVGGAWILIILQGLMIGPMVGFFATLPLGFLYLDEVASAAPATLGGQAWLLLLTMLLVVPVAVIWAYVDLRKQIAKLAR